MATTVNLFGMCAIGIFEKRSWAIMPSSDHHATVFVEAEKCDLDQPIADGALIVQDNNGAQWLGWNVTNKELQFSDSDGPAKWASKNGMLDLEAYHPGVKSRRSGKATRFLLTNGDLSKGPGFEETYEVTQKGAVKANQPFGASVSWTGEGLKLQCDHKPLCRLRNGATLSVANLAQVLNGHHHFYLYYDSVLPDISKDDRVSLEVPHRHVHVYDCVPPVVLP